MMKMSTHRIQVALCGSFLALALACSGSHPVASVLVLRRATLIDGTGGPPLANATVVVKGNRILQVASGGPPLAPTGARVVDLAGKWMIPGMIDAHIHFNASGGLYSRPDVYDLRNRVPYEREQAWIRSRIPFTLSRYLCAGVTSVLALGDPRWQFQVRDADTEGTSPRVSVVGPFIQSAPLGPIPIWTQDDPAIVHVVTPEDARSVVRKQVARHADLVKTGYIPDSRVPLADYIPILQAIVAESHAHGLRVVVHAEELEAAKAALRAGADVLAHTVGDEPVDEEFLKLATTRDVVSITTLWEPLGYAQVLTGHRTLLSVERACGDSEVIASWGQLEAIPPIQRPPVPEWVTTASSPRARSILLGNIRRMYERGVLLAVGTDASNIGTLHGGSYEQELLLLAQAGVPPMQILVAATNHGARALGRAYDLGTITPGKLADIVVLNTDPLIDISNTADISLVIKDGRIVPQNSRRSH